MLLECKLHAYRSVSADVCGTKMCGYTELILSVKLVAPPPPPTHTHTVTLKLTSLMYCTCDVTLPLVRVNIVTVVKQLVLNIAIVFLWP